jgi:hypothetical protein
MNNNHKSVEVALNLGAKGYSSMTPVDGVLRFDANSDLLSLFSRSVGFRSDVPSLDEMMQAPSKMPLLMTEDGTVWSPNEVTRQMELSLRAIAELFAIPPTEPLNSIYSKIVVYLDQRQAAEDQVD